MIRQPTLFVLGAGASQPYGFPTAATLRKRICVSKGGTKATDEDAAGLGFTLHDLKYMAGEFSNSNVTSIDAFLSRRPNLHAMGKALIASYLCRFENPEHLSTEAIEDDWFRYLWNRLIDGADNAGQLLNNEVRFITFNYDRSLEYLLYSSAKATYGVDDESALKLSSFPILHVYGQLGKFSLTDHAEDERSYSPHTGTRALRVAAAGINIMPEARDDGPTFQAGRKWFDWAERVYILGFGFDRLNCERLGFADVLRCKNGRPMPEIAASAFDLSQTEVTRAHKLLLGDPPAWQWDPHHATSLMALRRAGLPN